MTAADLSAQLADLHASRTPVRIVGGGTWPAGGHPVSAAVTLDTTATRGILSYAPEDLVLVAGAGTTLAELDEATRRHGQWLAVDPPGSREATIGGLVATASSGPLALGAGRTRDLVLGLTLLRSDGVAIRAGANVVKNVAGFDLVRLVTGSWGTLGVVTQASFRLHARPIVDETAAVAVGVDAIRQLPTTLGLRALQYLALELLSPATSARILPEIAAGAPPASWTLLARAAGNADRTTALIASLTALGPVRRVDPAAWDTLRSDDAIFASLAAPSDHVRAICRTSGPSSAIADTIKSTAHSLTSSGITRHAMRASPHVGSVRVIFAATPAQATRAVAPLRQAAHRVIWEELPPAAWSSVAPSARDPLSLRIRRVFDPHHRLNPGILG